MELSGAGLLDEVARILGGDACAGEDFDSSGGFFDESADEGCALWGGGLLARGEDPGEAQVDDLLEGGEGIFGAVEGSVEH